MTQATFLTFYLFPGKSPYFYMFWIQFLKVFERPKEFWNDTDVLKTYLRTVSYTYSNVIIFFNVITIYTWGYWCPRWKKPRTHFTSHKLIHKSILYCYAYNSTWKTVFCILTEFIFYGKLSLPSAWLFRAVCEWFFLGCWRVRPIEKLVRTGSSRLQASQFLRTIDYNQFSKEIEEKILCIICTPPLICGLCGKEYFYCN